MTGNESGRNNRLEGLQVLRGVAALLVLWCHLKYSLGRDVENYLNVPFLGTNLGAIGVDIFFAISGFVISMTGAKMANNWRGFLALRVARIVPLYFAISTFSLLEAVISGHVGGRYSGRQIFNSYGFIPLFDGPGFTGPILVNGWTLSFEMWFYLCFAGLLKLGSGSRAWLLLPAFFAARMAVNMAFDPGGAWYLPKFLFHPMTLEFCAGCVLYHVRNRIGKPGLYVMGGLSLLFFYLAYDKSYLGEHWTILNDAKVGLRRAIVWGGFATCLVGAVSQIDLRYLWKWPRFLLLLGDASYSIYLIPAVLMTAFAIVINHLGKFTGHDRTPPPFWYGSIYVLGSVTAGIACWKFFELPATGLTRKFLFRFVPDQRAKQIPQAENSTNETYKVERVGQEKQVSPL